MLRKTILLFAAAFFVMSGFAANAAPPAGHGPGHPKPTHPPHPPHPTHPPHPGPGYPPRSGSSVRDANGNLVSADHGLRSGAIMDIVSDGWLADGPVTFTFFSSPIVLGVRQAVGDGTVSSKFAVPAVSAGMHTLRLTGTGADGSSRTVEYPVKVLSGAKLAAASFDTARGVSGGSSSSLFGHAGATRTAEIGFALFAIGAALALAVRRSRGSSITA